jgi:SAM-dependent methyltransferase
VGLAELLGYREVRGVDLSPRMVQAANRNAEQRGHGQRITFGLGDVTQRGELPDDSADLCTFFDAAHHMPDLDAVRAVVAEMERVTHPQGLIVMLDLARLANAALTERYVETLGSDYRTLGLDHFLEDFRHSMYAAWTVDELATTVPCDSARCWIQSTPFGLPTMQLVIGLPVGRRELYMRGPMRPPIARHIPKPFHKDLEMVQRLLRFGRRRTLSC